MGKSFSMKVIMKVLKFALVIDIILVLCLSLNLFLTSSIKSQLASQIQVVKKQIVDGLQTNYEYIVGVDKETTRNSRAIGVLKKEVSRLQDDNRILLAKLEAIECMKKNQEAK